VLQSPFLPPFLLPFLLSECAALRLLLYVLLPLEHHIRRLIHLLRPYHHLGVLLLLLCLLLPCIFLHLLCSLWRVIVWFLLRLQKRRRKSYRRRRRV